VSTSTRKLQMKSLVSEAKFTIYKYTNAESTQIQTEHRTVFQQNNFSLKGHRQVSDLSHSEYLIYLK
jgi:hypothetical protein